MESSEYSTKVQGMICPQCEDELATALLHTRGVLSAEVSYRKGEARTCYDPQQTNPETIRSVMENCGFPPGGNGKAGLISDLISAAAVVLLLFLIPRLTGSVSAPVPEQGASCTTLFIIGVLTGVHCIGMCGGIMLTQKSAAVYNGARVLSCTLVGAALGALGTVISYSDQTRSMVLTVCGILVVIIGLRMWGVPALRNLQAAFSFPKLARGGPVLTGFLTGFMPCGALTSMWIVAAASGSATEGAAAMASFALGTCVFMLLFGSVGAMVPKKYNRYLLRVSTVLILAMGLGLIIKGLRVILV